MIGVRTDGLKTLSTLGSGEGNKHGSEFEEISPDRVYAVKEKRKYEEFCHRVIARRLSRECRQINLVQISIARIWQMAR